MSQSSPAGELRFDGDVSKLTPDLVMRQVVDPEIASFEREFSKYAGTELLGLEKEALRAYIYFKLRGPPQAPTT